MRVSFFFSFAISGCWAFTQPATNVDHQRLELTQLQTQKADTTENNRRSFLLSTGLSLITAATVGITTTTTTPSPANAAASVDYKSVATDISSLLKADIDKAPTLIRLAWHSSGTYDKMSKDGGSGPGTIRFKEELAHGGNAGLAETAVPWLEPIHEKYADAGLSYADLYTLGGGMLLNCV